MFSLLWLNLLLGTWGKSKKLKVFYEQEVWTQGVRVCPWETPQGSIRFHNNWNNNCLGNPINGLLWWHSGKDSACQRRRPGFNFWVGKIPWRRKWLSTPVFWPGKSHGQRSLAGYSPWGHKESDIKKTKTNKQKTKSQIWLSDWDEHTWNNNQIRQNWGHW